MDKYQPSVFSLNLEDKKMAIPNNKFLLEEVIQSANSEAEKEALYEQKKKAGKIAIGMDREDQMMEIEIEDIKNKMRGKLSGIKEYNAMQFLEFLLSNYDYNHKVWKLGKDMASALKIEDQRNMFMACNGDLGTFQGLMSGQVAETPVLPFGVGQNLNSTSNPSLNPSNGNFFMTQPNFLPAVNRNNDLQLTPDHSKLNEVSDSENEDDCNPGGSPQNGQASI